MADAHECVNDRELKDKNHKCDGYVSQYRSRYRFAESTTGTVLATTVQGDYSSVRLHSTNE